MPPPPPPPPPDLLTQQILSLLSPSSLHPHPTWLLTLLSTLKPAPPPALAKTASVRLLQTDFTRTLAVPPTNVLPADILHAGAGNAERRVGEEAGGMVPVQVLGVEDVGRSRMAQLEGVEEVERGEGRRGWEVIRLVREEGEDGPEEAKGMCKVLLEDAAGRRCYGVEVVPIGALRVGMAIGTKMMLRNTLIARGVLLLEPDTCIVLGGKIEALHEQWVQTRKKELRAALGMAEE